jgi:hypothetical protein
MKILITTIITALFCTGFWNSASAQCSETINTTSTDWRDYPGTSINNWDWTQSGSIHPIYLLANESSPSAYIELPYFCSKPVGTGTCYQNHNTKEYEFKGAGKEHQDIHPEDGWELHSKREIITRTLVFKTENGSEVLEFTGERIK